MDHKRMKQVFSRFHQFDVVHKHQSQRRLSDGENDELPWACWFGQELFDEVFDEVFPVQDRLSVSGTDGIAPSEQVFPEEEVEPLHVALGR